MSQKITVDVEITRRSYYRRFALALCEGAGVMAGILLVAYIAGWLGP